MGAVGDLHEERLADPLPPLRAHMAGELYRPSVGMWPVWKNAEIPMSDPILEAVITTIHVHRPVTHPSWTSAEIDACAADIVAQLVAVCRDTHDGREWLRDLCRECGMTE